ncbi:MAG: hypothetical protein NT075_29155 [Chloroflexi bacterium]|nr:hypothetical protein [Chloroflexota bacterium]
MILRVTALTLRLCGFLALLLGLLFWVGIARNLLQLHLLFGLLVTLLLWLVGIDQVVAETGNRVIGIGLFVLGLFLPVVGIFQASILVGPMHWVIQLIHLLLGVMAIGIGQVSVTRARKSVVGPGVN